MIEVVPAVLGIRSGISVVEMENTSFSGEGEREAGIVDVWNESILESSINFFCRAKRTSQLINPC